MRLLELQNYGFVICLLLQLAFAFDTTRFVPANSLRLKRGATQLGVPPPPFRCSEHIVNSSTNNASETCFHLYEVAKHVSSFGSSQPIPVPSLDDHQGLEEIIDLYNEYLNTSKNNCRSWNIGEGSVLSLIRKLVVVAKEFEPKFYENFKRSQARLVPMMFRHEHYSGIDGEILILEEDLELAKKTASKLPPNIRQHFEIVFNGKEQKLNELLGKRREIEELIVSLEMLRNNAADVEKVAEKARITISDFRDTVAQDANAFRICHGRSQRGINIVERLLKENNQTLLDHMREKMSLAEIIRKARLDIIEGKKKNEQYSNELRAYEVQLARILEQIRIQQRFNPFFGIVEGLRMMFNHRNSVKATIERKKAIRNEIMRKLREQNYRLARSFQRESHLMKEIFTLEAKTRQLKQEFQYYIELIENLQIVQNEVDSILPTAELAKEAIVKVRSTFHDVAFNIGNLIEEVKEFLTKGKEKNFLFFSFNSLEVLRCYWGQVSEKITFVGRCVTYLP